VQLVAVVVTVTVYIVVPAEERETLGFASVPLLSPVVGDQLYVLPATGDEPIEALPSAQKKTLLPASATGKVFTVTLTEAVEWQLLALPTLTE
jgi:hypothetical protein